MEDTPKKRSRREAPPLSRETAERRCIDASYDLAYKQIKSGKASPSVICHFLKMGTEQAKLERIKLENETELIKTRNISIKEGENTKKMIEEALTAFKSYSGAFNNRVEDDDEEYYDDDY